MSYQGWSGQMAQYDFDEARLRRILAQRLQTSRENKVMEADVTRDSDSARGLLNSGMALKDQSNVAEKYAKVDSDLNQGTNDQLGDIARGRASSTADYNAEQAAQAAENAKTTPLLTPIASPSDPNDPLGWAAIAASQKAAGNPAFGGTNSGTDPNDWGAIATQLGNSGDPNFAQYKTKKPQDVMFNPLAPHYSVAQK